MKMGNAFMSQFYELAKSINYKMKGQNNRSEKAYKEKVREKQLFHSSDYISAQ